MPGKLGTQTEMQSIAMKVSGFVQFLQLYNASHTMIFFISLLRYDLLYEM